VLQTRAPFSGALPLCCKIEAHSAATQTYEERGRERESREERGLESGAAVGVPELELGAGRGGTGVGARVGGVSRWSWGCRVACASGSGVRAAGAGRNCWGSRLPELELESGGGGAAGPGLRAVGVSLELHVLDQGPFRHGRTQKGEWVMEKWIYCWR
jgi:hypothetical protein